MSRILITGASRGIGRGIAEVLAAKGHEVIATARDASMLADVPAVARLQLDVTDESSVSAAVAAAGPVDALVSNAGATVRAPMETVPVAEVQRLIFISSIQGRIAIPLIGPYAASKWALEAIAETLAIEAAHFGISVHLLEVTSDDHQDRRARNAVPPVVPAVLFELELISLTGGRARRPGIVREPPPAGPGEDDRGGHCDGRAC